MDSAAEQIMVEKTEPVEAVDGTDDGGVPPQMMTQFVGGNGIGEGISTAALAPGTNGEQQVLGEDGGMQQQQGEFDNSAASGQQSPSQETMLGEIEGDDAEAQQAEAEAAAHEDAQLQEAPAACPPDCTLWMGGMRTEWTADFVREAFKLMGVENIENVRLLNDRHDANRPATYCFVEFADADSARMAMVAAVGHTIRNDPEKSRFHLSFANSSTQTTEYNLFISNLHPSTDDADLFRLFGERYASCRGAKVYRQMGYGESREFGFVRFTSETDQQRALVEMNKHKLKGKEMLIKLAMPKQRIGRYYVRGHGREYGGGGVGRREGSSYSSGGGGYSRGHGGGGGSSLGGAGLLPTPPATYALPPQIGAQLATVLGIGAGGLLAAATPLGMVQAAGGTVPPMIQVGNHGAAGFGTPVGNVMAAAGAGVHHQPTPQGYVTLVGPGGGAAGVLPVMAAAAVPGQPPTMFAAAPQYAAAAYQQHPSSAYNAPHMGGGPTYGGRGDMGGGGGGYRSSRGSSSYHSYRSSHHDPSYSSYSRYHSTSRRRPYSKGRSESPKPKPTIFEGVEPLSAEEHNEVMMRNAGDFLCTLESSRWNRVGVKLNAKTKDVANLLYNAL